MTEKQIFNTIKHILIDEFEIEEEEIQIDSHLYDDLDLDSLDGVDLIVALEKAFNFKVDREKDEASLKKLLTVKDIVNYIESKDIKD